MRAFYSVPEFELKRLEQTENVADMSMIGKLGEGDDWVVEDTDSGNYI